MDGFEESIGGKWKLVRNEGFDEYLSAMGVGYIKRKIASAFSTVTELTKVGDRRIRIVTDGPKHSDDQFNLDDEVEELDPFDNKVKVKVTWDPQTRVMRTEAVPVPGSKAKHAVVERKVEPSGELLMQITLPDENLVCRRYFKKHQS